jgi:glycosyltransferase involved in cell wall biosynthesis
MEVIIYSKSIIHLDVNLATTSSQIFEIEFARALASYNKVSIISSQAKQREKDKYKDVSLYPQDNSKKLKFTLKENIENHSLFIENEKVLIFFGYDYFILNHLNWVCEKFEARLISYTFDTHKAAIEHRKGLRKFLINVYFQLGIQKLNSIDGIILFNEEAYRELDLRIPYIISKVGINDNEISSKVYRRNENKCFNIVYAGSLESYNGVLKMIDAMKLLPSNSVSFDIYGKGTLINDVIRESAKDPRIHYKGLIPRGEVDSIIQNADLLLNLRNTNHYVNKFAFPSKLIQYLSSGIPVLTTRVIKDPAFNNIAFVIDHYTPEEISEMIAFIIDNPEEQQKRAALAKNYIRDNFLWENVIKEVNNFLKKISF